MEETVIVIMLKDPLTGFLEKELAYYTISANEDLIYNIYATANDKGTLTVYLKLSVKTDVSDWEYNAIFDYYDSDALLPYVDSICQDTEEYNPTWLVSFAYIDNAKAMEEKLSSILQAHKTELESVIDVIPDKKDDYIDETK